MRILVAGRGFDSPGKHSLGIFELDQARALQAAGHDVRFAAIDTRSIRRKRPLGRRKYDMGGVPVYYYAIPGIPKPALLAEGTQKAAAAAIWKMLARDGWLPEIVHAHFGAGFLHEAKKHGIPTVYTEHFSAANQINVPPEELRRERETYALADKLICVSNALAARVTEHTGVQPRVIHNIADTGVFSRNRAAKMAKEGFHFVSAGNLIPGKGFDLLLEAFARARAKREDIHLTVIGDGPEGPLLKALAQRLRVEESVGFTGRLSREEMSDIYRQADAFVLASRGETFGLVYIEAMAAGLPVIATACGGPEDFINNSNGIMVPVDDISVLTDAMMRMIDISDRFDSETIARFAVENFSPENIAGQITAVYKELCPC